MSMSEEEQMAMMLKEMGMNSLDQLDEASGVAAPEEVVQASIVTSTPARPSVEFSDNLVLADTENRSSAPLPEGVHKDLTITSLTQLLGLPTAKQLYGVEAKLDLIFNKLEVLQAKTDRLNTQLEVNGAGPSGQKIEFQVSEMRAIMKKFFPQAFAANLSAISSETDLAKAGKSDNGKSTQVSGEVKKETKIHLDVPEAAKKSTEETQEQEEEIIEEEPLSDEDYQALESKKLREEMAEKFSEKK